MPTIAPTRLHHHDRPRVLRHHGEVERAERADPGRFGRGADAEQDHREHHDGEHAERDDRADQLLQDLELLAVHPPEIEEEQEDRERREAPEPRVEVRGDPPRRLSAAVGSRSDVISSSGSSFFCAVSALGLRRGPELLRLRLPPPAAPAPPAPPVVADRHGTRRSAQGRCGDRLGRVVDDHVPPRRGEGPERQQQGHQQDEQVLDDQAIGRRLPVLGACPRSALGRNAAVRRPGTTLRTRRPWSRWRYSGTATRY